MFLNHGRIDDVVAVVDLNEFVITRNENIIVLATPLFVIDAIALIALILQLPPVVNYYARIVLVANTTSSMQDVYNVVRLAAMPGDAQFINVFDESVRSFYCVKSSSDTESTGMQGRS
ncbi:DUF3267 domain-containing protein [Haloarcula sp. JP-Z28]|uniref:DUF3267 domain-containing protein n=1 Tax=Haloarcula sp. JP-Z28 TaxID=2716715 RepID=UPI00351A839C